MKRLISALLFAGFAVTAAGCTAAQGNSAQGTGTPSRSVASKPAPAPDSFAAGSCRAMADDVLGVWNMSTGLQGHTELTIHERRALKARQQALIAAMAGAPSDVRKSLGELVNAIGWARLLSDTGNYTKAEMDRVVQADSAMQDACVK